MMTTVILILMVMIHFGMKKINCNGLAPFEVLADAEIKLRISFFTYPQYILSIHEFLHLET